MAGVRISRRLGAILLLTVTPVVAVYTHWSVQWSQRSYISDLKRETRATVRGLAPVLAGYVRQGQWAQVDQLFERMSSDGSEGALLKANGELWHAATSFPVSLMPIAKPGLIGADGFEFEHTDGGRYWFCRTVPLDPGNPIGYFLVAQDWSNIRESRRERMLAPIGAALIVVALIAVLIPVLVSHYVSAPIAGLRARWCISRTRTSSPATVLKTK
jgi:pentatricopeptide repeat protein